MKVFVTLSALFAVTMARGYSGVPAAYDQHQQQQHHQAAAYQAQPAAYQPQQAAYHQPQPAANHYNHQATEQQKAPIPIIRSESKHNDDGSYEFQYETGNGIVAGEQGYNKPGANKDEGIQVAQGFFQYTGEDGIPISLKYVADENGFQPIGDHLPTPPPLPKEIVEALEKIAADPRHNDGDDGQYHGESNAAGHYNAQQHQQPQHQQAQQYHQQPQQQQNHYKY